MNITKPTAETLPKDPLARLLAVMAWLRDRQHGCPWDIDQTFRTIAPYTIEEAYEVADAIERNDMPAPWTEWPAPSPHCCAPRRSRSGPPGSASTGRPSAR